jgi:sec-independent protein translocase protein TatA
MGLASDLFRGPGWIIILVIVLLLFGAPRLPALARSLGQSMKIFRSEIKTAKDDPDAEASDAVETDAAEVTAKPAAKQSAKQSKPKS